MDDSVLTNRELAALLVLVGLAGFVLSRPGRGDLLKSVGRALRSLSERWILIPLLLYIGWICIAVGGASRLGFWNLGLLKATILWLLISGLALVMGLNEAIRESGFFRRALIRTLGFIVVVEFIATLKSFPLWVEIPGQGLAVMFAMVGVVAEHDPQHAPVRKIANGYLFLFGISAVTWSMTYFVMDWSTLDHGAIIREFLLPIWLTPLALVFVYGFAVVAAYQSTFLQMRIWKTRGSLSWPRLAMMLRANGRLGYLRLLSGSGAQRIARTEGFLNAWRAIGVLRRKARTESKNPAPPGTSRPRSRMNRLDNAASSGVAAPFNASLRLAAEHEDLLRSAAEELGRSKEEVKALHERLLHSHEAFEWLGPIELMEVIHYLAQRARTMEEIEVMALPVAMLFAISQLESLEELVEKFDRLLRLAGEPAIRAMSVADSLTAATQTSTATFSEMLDATIAAYES